ncbi:MAG: hypothetical protein JWN68_877 [Nocardioides sp.]|uniref:hypothetical protein n=1 Tax=Nocardioides sp. TaxID=35761 RepID=UPI002618EB94|nr:hypothetical protein [Nocardioides sp.]MCW2832924.1 hypothetical protein [Nocardioides sp.]
MSSRTRIGAALVMISFILATVFAFAPANFNTSTVTWLPESAADSGALQLTRQAPHRISVETTCDMARAATQPSLLSTGTLELSVVEEKVLVQTAPLGPVAEVSLPPGDCAIRASYTLDTSLLRLSVDDVHARSRSFIPPRIDGLYTSDPRSWFPF